MDIADALRPIVPIVVVLTFLLELSRAPLRRGLAWLFRRRTLERRLRRLACDVQLAHFEHVLGIPPQYRSLDGPFTEYVFVFDDVFVQAIADEGNRVVRFAFTTRSQRFSPTFLIPGSSLRVRLGHTTFGQLSSQPGSLRAFVGARRFFYAEADYFGNPGFYQHYVFALNEVGVLKGDTLGQLRTVIEQLGSRGELRVGLFSEQGFSGERVDADALPEFRAGMAINTYGEVLGTHRPTEKFLFGPEGDRVRLLTHR